MYALMIVGYLVIASSIYATPYTYDTSNTQNTNTDVDSTSTDNQSNYQAPKGEYTNSTSPGGYSNPNTTDGTGTSGTSNVGR